LIIIACEIIIIIYSLSCILNPAKIIEKQNASRVAKGNQAFTEAEIAKKAKTLRIVGVVALLIAVAALASDILGVL